MSKVSIIKQDTRCLETRVLPIWLAGVNMALKRYARLHTDENGVDSPFCYNETASVSVLCAGAYLANYVALADYRIGKRRGKTGLPVKGRCDLYLYAEDRTWAFEFKQLLPYSAPTATGRLASNLEKSLAAVAELTGIDHERAFASLIVPLIYLAVR